MIGDDGASPSEESISRSGAGDQEGHDQEHRVTWSFRPDGWEATIHGSEAAWLALERQLVDWSRSLTGGQYISATPNRMQPGATEPIALTQRVQFLDGIGTLVDIG